MELATLVTKPTLSGGELAEVARSPWTDIIIELEYDSSCSSGVDEDVKLHARGRELKKANVCGKDVRRRC